MKSILVIRRDNIGDLVCTTPLIRALRQHFPHARIDALVNSYNLPVVACNPDLNEAFAYTKAKHRNVGTESYFGVLWRRAKLMWSLRRRKYELVVLANGGCLERPLRLARQLRPKHILGFYSAQTRGSQAIDIRVANDRQNVHEVEALFELLRPLGINGPAGELVLCPSAKATERSRSLLREQIWYRRGRATIAIHISARKPSQRWPSEHFVETLIALRQRKDIQFMLFWSPGNSSNPLHPGDDDKATSILESLPADFPLLAFPTHHLEELIGGLSVCDGMLCSDGGAMHIGAAVGLPIVCFFGNSDVATWRPWKVPHRVLQAGSLDAKDIPVHDALTAIEHLWEHIEQRTRR